MGLKSPFSHLGDFNISAFKNKMRPKSVKWDQISHSGPIFGETPNLPLKLILNVKNITYFKYYIGKVYYFRFIFVSLQRKWINNICKVCLMRYVPSIGMQKMHSEGTSIWRLASASRRCLSVSSVWRIDGSRM